MSVWTDDGQGLEVEPQFDVYTFTFYITTPSPIVGYKNKWPGDWASYWFYRKAPLDPSTKCHPLVLKEIGVLGETPDWRWTKSRSTKPSSRCSVKCRRSSEPET